MSGGGKPSPERVAAIVRRYYRPRLKYGTQGQFFKACAGKKVALRTNGDETGKMELLSVEELYAHFRARLIAEQQQQGQ